MAAMLRSESAGTPIGAGFARHLRPDARGLAAFRVQADADCARSLSTLIEIEIIPRLVVAHASDAPALEMAHTAPVIEPDEVDALAPMALQVEADALLNHVEAILARGVPIEMVLVDLLAPTARLLGEFWEADRCDFIEVTMGLWRLQEIVHELAARVPTDRRGAIGYRALFASMPGDQHSFGTVVIDEMFRREGWTTDRISEVETPDLLKRVADESFDMVGLTISCDCHTANLTSIIAALRNVSRNPRVCVMVGGRVFSADPALAERVGADGTARDARLALDVAGDLVRARAMETVYSG